MKAARPIAGYRIMPTAEKGGRARKSINARAE